MTGEVRVAVAGTRARAATPVEAATFHRLWKAIGGTVLLHGCCLAAGEPRSDGVPKRMRGIDAWVEERAAARGVPVERCPPLQVSIGWPGCGPERSRRMVKAADVVVCFPGGRGTERTAGFASEFGRPLYRIYTIDGNCEWTGPCPICGAEGDGYSCGCCAK